MLEWLKRHAWKACILQKGIPSSNLGLSAPKTRPEGGFFVSERPGRLRYPSLNPSLREGLDGRSRRSLRSNLNPTKSQRQHPSLPSAGRLMAAEYHAFRHSGTITAVLVPTHAFFHHSGTETVALVSAMAQGLRSGVDVLMLTAYAVSIVMPSHDRASHYCKQ